MSDYCPHCDDYSIDSSRARRKPLINDASPAVSNSEVSEKIIVDPDKTAEAAENGGKR